jgi:acyl-CoA thioesterase
VSDAHDELRASIDGLSEEQARTALNWLVVMRRDTRSLESEQSVGPLGDLLGMATVSREPGRCRMRLEVDPAWHNPNGVLHGGVIYTMIDNSMGGAVQPNLPQSQACATIEVKVSYLAAVREGTLTVDTEVIRQGRNIAFLESRVRDETGKLVATGSGSMYIFEVPGGSGG